MNKIYDIAKVTPTRWGDIATQIDINFEEVSKLGSVFNLPLTANETLTLNSLGRLTKNVSNLSSKFNAIRMSTNGSIVSIPKIADYNNGTQAAYRVEFIEGDNRTIISAFVNGSVCNLELTSRNEADVIKLQAGSTTAVKESNKTLLKNIQGHFFCSVNFGYGVGTWQPGQGGFIHVITAYGIDVFYDIATDYSIIKNDSYVKPNEPLQVKLNADLISTVLDDVTAYKISMCGELCVEGSTGPIMHFRASDSTTDNIYFINYRKDGKRTILTFDINVKTLNASIV